MGEVLEELKGLTQNTLAPLLPPRLKDKENVNKVKNFVTNELSKKSSKFKYSEVFRKLIIRQIL